MAHTLSAVQLAAQPSHQLALKPLPLWQALLYFGLPALGFRLAFYNGLPILLSLGLTPFRAFAVTVIVPTAILFALALGFFKWEGHSLTWAALAERFRLRRLTGRDWLWTIGGLVVAFMGSGLLAFTAPALIVAFPALNPPAFFPAVLNPNTTLSAQAFTDYIAEPVRGNWGLVLLQFVMLFFNIFGEEFWWRGLILPRQERVHGRFAWLVHGLLWTLFHVPFYPWQLFALMPVCLTLAFVCQKTGNTITGIIMHYVYNGISFVLVLLAVSGLIA
jgi:membrane protease YdiL (CAAX protease family)